MEVEEAGADEKKMKGGGESHWDLSNGIFEKFKRDSSSLVQKCFSELKVAFRETLAQCLVNSVLTRVELLVLESEL